MFVSDILKEQVIDSEMVSEIVVWKDSGVDLGDAVCAIGAFDGVHQGHHFLIQEAVSEARARGIASIVVTFDVDPDELFLPQDELRKILSNTDRHRWLSTVGADYVLVVPFGKELSTLAPQMFLDSICSSAFTPLGIHVGSDFRFGFKAAGGVAEMVAWGETNNCAIHPHVLLCEEGIPVTATRIRGLIEAGAVADAALLLTRPHYIRARVIRGRGAGSDLGFPTANLAVEYPYVRAADGVYAGYVYVDDTAYPAAISIGVPSTFAGTPHSIEVHILGFDGDIYGKEVKLSLLEYLREMRTFGSAGELTATVNENIDWVRTNLH